MRKRGFSLVELITVIGIITVVFSIIGTTYITLQRLWESGFKQLTFQSRGRIILAKISDAMRLSTEATILDNGDKIRFVTDPNGTPTTADDITQEYYISGLSLIYDPDISIAGNETSLLDNVYKESAIPFFQLSGDLAVITFRLYNNSIVYGVQWSNMTTSVKMRNTI